jgi:hypothetical protein
MSALHLSPGLALSLAAGCIFLCFALFCFLATLSAWPQRRATKRPAKRPGYIRPSLSASDSASPITGLTRTLTATSTGCKTAGRPLAEVDGLALRAALSRTTAPTSYGDVTASVRGDHTTDADAA